MNNSLHQGSATFRLELQYKSQLGQFLPTKTKQEPQSPKKWAHYFIFYAFVVIKTFICKM